MSKKRLFTSLFILFVVTEGMTQAFYAVRRDHDLIVSFGTGTSTYLGEFQNPGDNIDFKPSLNVGAQIFIAPNFLNNRLSVRSELTFFRLQGTDVTADDDRVTRNLNFFSNNWELNATGLLHLFKQDKKFYKRYVFNIYGMTGIGLMYMNPKTDYQGEKIKLKPLETEGVTYSRFQFVIPYGFGIKFRKGNLYNIALEAGWRKTFSDYLDDASGKRYPDPALLKSDLARTLSDRRVEYFSSIGIDYTPTPNVGVRGNPERKDSYVLLNIKLEYFLPIDLFTDEGRLMWMKQKPTRRR